METINNFNCSRESALWHPNTKGCCPRQAPPRSFRVAIRAMELATRVYLPLGHVRMLVRNLPSGPFCRCPCPSQSQRETETIPSSMMPGSSIVSSVPHQHLDRRPCWYPKKPALHRCHPSLKLASDPLTRARTNTSTRAVTKKAITRPTIINAAPAPAARPATFAVITATTVKSARIRTIPTITLCPMPRPNYHWPRRFPSIRPIRTTRPLPTSVLPATAPRTFRIITRRRKCTCRTEMNPRTTAI